MKNTVEPTIHSAQQILEPELNPRVPICIRKPSFLKRNCVDKSGAKINKINTKISHKEDLLLGMSERHFFKYRRVKGDYSFWTPLDRFVVTEGKNEKILIWIINKYTTLIASQFNSLT